MKNTIEQVKQVEQEAGKLLGKQVQSTEYRNPDLLVPFSRKKSLESCNINPDEYTWYGIDIWNLYECRVKDSSGKALNFTGRLMYDAKSPYIIESKSMKLYIQSLMEEKMGSSNVMNRFGDVVVQDIGAKINSKPSFVPEKYHITHNVALKNCDIDLASINDSRLYTCILDHLYIEDNNFFVSVPRDQNGKCLIDYDADKVLKLSSDAGPKPEASRIYTIFMYFSGKSNCLVTGAPDYFTAYILMENTLPVDKYSLLNYLQSFEHVNRFHESTCHTIFDRLVKKFKTDEEDSHVTVFLKYTRRGGIDISPMRTTNPRIYYKFWYELLDKNKVFPQEFNQ